MGLKIFGLGLINYSRDKMNLFDAAIIIINIIEMIMSKDVEGQWIANL